MLDFIYLATQGIHPLLVRKENLFVVLICKSRKRKSHLCNNQMIPATSVIKRVVTQDEIWAHHFDQESKMQSKQWENPGSNPPKKFKRVHLAGKVIASILWDSRGVIITDYLQQGRTVHIMQAN